MQNYNSKPKTDIKIRCYRFGLDVIKDKNKFMMHHKVFIIDKKIVVTGSFNPTGNGDTNNDENILIIHDEGVAQKYLKEFERVWSYERINQ